SCTRATARASSPAEISSLRESSSPPDISSNWRSSSAEISSFTPVHSVAELAGISLKKFRLLGRCVLPVAIAGQSVKRKSVPVQMILQIENTWKSRSRKVVLIPRTVGVLMLHKPVHRAQRSRIIRPGRRQQSDQTPGRLRSCALADSLE